MTKSKYRKRVRDPERMLWIKEQSCCAANDLLLPSEYVGPCQGVTEADHAGGGSGMGRKAPDHTCIPLCVRHHRAPGLDHLLYGHVPHGYVREWKSWQVEKYRNQYDEMMEAM